MKIDKPTVNVVVKNLVVVIREVNYCDKPASAGNIGTLIANVIVCEQLIVKLIEWSRIICDTFIN